MYFKGTWRKLISSQRKRAVMACFRMAPLHSMPHHRAINLFLKSYKNCWLEVETENATDLACLIPDLCPQTASADLALTESEVEPVTTATAIAPVIGEENVGKEAAPSEASPASGGGEANAEQSGTSANSCESPPDPLRQLIACFNRAATTEQGNTGMANLAEDMLYQVFSDCMSRSCEIVDEDDEAEAPPGEEEDQANSFEEAEMQKQKLLFEQGRLADRGATEMTLLYISASKGEKTDMLEKTLQLGISLLHGGNISVQQRM